MKKPFFKGIALNRSHLCYFVRRLMLIIEIAVMAMILVLVWDRFYNDAIPVPIFRRGYYPLGIFYAGVLFLCLKALKGRGFGDARLFDIMVAQALSLLMCNILFYFPLCLLSYRVLNPYWLIWMTLAQMLLILPFCFLFNRLFFYLFRPMEVVFITDDAELSSLPAKIGHFSDQFRIVDTVSAGSDRADLRAALRTCQGVLLETQDRSLLDWLTMQCFTKNLFLFLVPNVQDIALNCAKRFNLVDTPLLATGSHRISTSDLFIKRCVDITVSLLGLVIASPLMLICAFAVRLGDGGPVLFRQERLTLDGKPFRLIKFRTMIVNAERGGQRLACEGDKRITRVGSVLRKTRLDELPQLWNVLRGDMSLVGPRPECPALAAHYAETIPEFSYRLKVRAGITGMAQVYGNYDTSPRDKCLMDIMYIEDYSLALDFKLILLTLRTLFLTYKTRGVSLDASETVDCANGTESLPDPDPDEKEDFSAPEASPSVPSVSPAVHGKASDTDGRLAAQRFLAAFGAENREGR